jgi:hypothetical protein
MTARALTIAFVAMLLVSSAAAQASTARSKSNGSKCARFPNCARCGPAPLTVAGGRRRRPQVCLECGPNTVPEELDNGGLACPCEEGQSCNFSARAWTAYARGEGLCGVSTSKRGGSSRRSRCPPRPTGCVACGTELEGCFIAASGACAYTTNGDVTVTAGRRLFGVDEELWA